MTDPDRIAALDAALEFHEQLHDIHLQPGVAATVTYTAGLDNVRNTAEVFLAWLRGPRRIQLLRGAVLSQATGLPTGTPNPQGDTVQLHDNEKFDLSVQFEDAKGFVTQDADPVSWSSSDETVAAVTASADTLTGTVVAGNPGNATITVSVTLVDGTVLTATEAVDVVPAGAATISLVEGPVQPQ